MPIAFAGRWERWTERATDEQLDIYTIITTEPNELTAPIHNRMPVILSPNDYERWMAPADPAQLPVDLLRPFDTEKMMTWKVGKDVGSVKNNTPELLTQA
jgi:putative SOS response-associated peptidase YedK